MNTCMNPTGFREVPPEEQQHLQGGALPIVIAALSAAVAEIIHDWDNFKNGLMGRPEEKRIKPFQIEPA